MLKKILGSLFSGSDKESGKKHQTYQYSGFDVTPCPKSMANGWSTEAMIEKVVNGETKSHHFIRSDHSGSEDAALELITSKVKMCIDQQGVRIFS